MKTSEDKRMVILDFFGIAVSEHILKKISTIIFCAWSFLLVHIWFTPSEGPKGFVNLFFKKLEHGSWTIKLNHGKNHLP